MSKILIYANQQGENLSPGAKEALAFGSRLASSIDGEVEAILVGPEAEAGAREAIACGASKAYTVSNPLLAEYQVDLYVNTLYEVFQQSGADLFILSFDRIGKELVGRLATRLSASAITEVVDFKTEGRKLSWIRPIYGE